MPLGYQRMSLSKLNETPPKMTRGLSLLVLFLLTGGVYLGVSQCGFITFDDPDYVTQNPYVKQGLKWETVQWAFTHFHSSNWHPLTWCSHMVDANLFGQKPAGHHLHNLLLHCFNVSLLFLFLGRLTTAYGKAFLVAALFAVHPLHVESVAWVSERKDVLSTFFGLLTLLAYAQYAQSPATYRRRMAWYVAALFLYVLGLLSKPMLVTWPCLMLLLDYWPLQRFAKAAAIFHLPDFRRLLVEKLPFFMLAAVSCVVTMRAQGTGRSVISLEWLPLEVRLGNSLAAIFDYLLRTFVPVKLAVFYPFPAEIPWGKAFFAALILVVLFGLGIKHCKTRPWLLVGMAWFVGTMVPVIGLVQVGMQGSADRYTYIPHIGLFIALVWGLTESVVSWPRYLTVLRGLAVLILGVCSILTIRQVNVWRSDLTLFGHAKDVTERNYIALTIYGKQLADQGKYKEALALYQQAIEIQPRYAVGQYVMAEAYRNTGRTNEALASYTEALQLDPFHAESLNSRGALLSNLNRDVEARQDFLKAIEILPIFDLPRLNLGIVCQRQGRLEEAAQWFLEYLKLNPTSAKVLALLADVRFRQNQFDLAAQLYQQSLTQEPQRVGSRYGLACALAALQRFAAAEIELQQVLRLDPKMPEACFQLGIVLQSMQRPDQAITNLSRAVELKPTSALYRYHLAAGLDQVGRKVEAVSAYEQAIALDEEFAEPLNNLAWLLATTADAALRDGPRAVSLAEKACELTQQKETFLIGTLAAAYAAAGRFDDAVATAQRAVDLATATGQPPLAARNRELLELYRSGKPFREAAATVTHP